MTAEKVISLLNRIIDEDGHLYTDDARTALFLSVDYIQKEIPMEPKAVYTVVKPIAITDFRCGFCAKVVNNTYTYCPNCGQKIKWEEEDDGNNNK